jgi:uncharacterized protein
MKIREFMGIGADAGEFTVIDAHAHLGMTKFFYVPGDPSIDGLIKTMDRIGINQIAIAPHLAISSDFIAGNDLILKAALSHPDRVIALATMNLNYFSECLTELKRCFKYPVFKGIKLHPDFMTYSIQDTRLQSIIQFAADQGAFVLSHTDARISASHPLKYSDPTWFEPYIEKFPKVDFILAHCGLTPEAFPEALRLLNTYPNVYLDTTGFRFSNSWTVEEIVKRGSSRRLLFASDMPFNDAASALSRVLYANISEADKRLILGENMINILKKGGCGCR